MRWLKAAGWLVFGVVTFVVALTVSTYGYLRSARGREQLVVVGVQQLGKLFPGGIGLGAVDGDLTQGLVLHDVLLRDREGQPVIRADRLEIRYRLWSLLHTEVQVTKLAVSGLVIVSRPLGDGSNSLGSMVLTKPSAPSPPITALPVAFQLDELTVAGRFVARGADQATVVDLGLDLRLTGGVTRQLVARVANLDVDLHTPAKAHLTALGAVTLAGPISLDQLALRLETDASELRARVDEARVSGPLVLTAEAKGPLQPLGLDIHAQVTAPTDHLSVETSGHLGADRARVHSLVLSAPFADVKGHGMVTFAGDFEGKVHASVSDLARLHAFGAPKLGGSVVVDAEGGKSGSSLTVSARGHGHKVSGPGVAVGAVYFDGHARLAGRSILVKASGGGAAVVTSKVSATTFSFDVDTPDARNLVGRARAEVSGLRAGKVFLTKAKADVDGSATLTKLSVEATGPEKARLGLRMAGIPRREHGRLTGVSAGIDELWLTIHGQSWHQLHRAQLALDLDRPLVELHALDLASGDQRLSLNGKLSGSDGRWSTTKIDQAFVTARAIDLSQLAVLLSPGHVLPRTQISATASAHGPIDNPDVSGHVDAEVFGRGDHDLIHLVLAGDGRLSNRRLVASAKATIGGQRASGRVDLPMPFRPNSPVSADIDASVLLNSWFAEMLVPKLTQSQPLPMFLLDGKITVTATLRGTSSTPELHAAARLANWHMADARGDLGLSVEYADRRLNASFSTGLSSLPRGGGNGGGVIDATAQLPIDLPAFLSGTHLAMLPRDTPLHANAHIRNLGLEYLPLSAFQIDLPLQHGRIDANVDLSGTVDNPHLTADVAANQFDLGVLHAVSASARAELSHRAVTVDISSSVDGSEALRLHATMHGDAAVPVYRRGAWRHAELDGKGQIAAFELDRLHLLDGLGGVLHAEVAVHGLVSEPRGELVLSTDRLNLGAVAFHKLSAKAELDTKGLVAQVDSEQAPGGRLSLLAKLPWQGTSGEARLTARRFVVDLDGKTLSGIRTVRGRLDADLLATHLGLGSLHPQLAGSAELHDGQLRIASTSMDYHGIATRVRLDHRQITFDQGLLLAGEQGRITFGGKVELDDGRPARLSAKLVGSKFPFQQQGLGVLLDAEIDVTGARRSDGAFAGKIRVAHGSARLPELLQTRVLLPIGPLEDVRIVNRIQHPAQSNASGIGLQLGALLDGAFAIRGKEINATLRGGISVDLTGRVPVLRGSLRVNDGGWIDLLARRYDIERGVIAFDGSPNPRLSIRITRATPAAQIGIDVSGPANKPTLAFWSDPPVYDQAQVAGLVLSGDPGTSGVSTEGLDRQAIGAISSLLVTSIKQKLLPELPIDVFRFGANNSDGTGLGAQIEIGKYLAEKLYVGYAYQIGADRIGVRRTNQNEGRIDYRLPKQLDLEASFGDASVGGLDLFWTYRPKP